MSSAKPSSRRVRSGISPTSSRRSPSPAIAQSGPRQHAADVPRSAQPRRHSRQARARRRTPVLRATRSLACQGQALRHAQTAPSSTVDCRIVTPARRPPPARTRPRSRRGRARLSPRSASAPARAIAPPATGCPPIRSRNPASGASCPRLFPRRWLGCGCVRNPVQRIKGERAGDRHSPRPRAAAPRREAPGPGTRALALNGVRLHSPATRPALGLHGSGSRGWERLCPALVFSARKYSFEL